MLKRALSSSEPMGGLLGCGGHHDGVRAVHHSSRFSQRGAGRGVYGRADGAHPTPSAGTATGGGGARGRCGPTTDSREALGTGVLVTRASGAATLEPQFRDGATGA